MRPPSSSSTFPRCGAGRGPTPALGSRPPLAAVGWPCRCRCSVARGCPLPLRVRDRTARPASDLVTEQAKTAQPLCEHRTLTDDAPLATVQVRRPRHFDDEAAARNGHLERGMVQVARRPSLDKSANAPASSPPPVEADVPSLGHPNAVQRGPARPSVEALRARRCRRARRETPRRAAGLARGSSNCVRRPTTHRARPLGRRPLMSHYCERLTKDLTGVRDVPKTWALP